MPGPREPIVAPPRAPERPRLVLVIDALAARYGGTTYLVVQLAAALGRRDDVAAVHVVAQRSSLVARELRPGGVVRLHALDAPTRGELGWRVGWEALRLPDLLRRVDADALLTASGMLPRDLPCRVISLVSNPVPFVDRSRLGSRARRWAIARTSRRADAVYVPSREMVRLVDGGPAVKVVPLGVDRAIFRPGPKPGLDLLSVGDFYPHKRHDVVLAAWARLPRSAGELRLIGNPAVSPPTYEQVRATAAGLHGVVVEGRVPLARLVAAYREARALVIASERESFCMPIAEALACGTPAVVRDSAVLRETAGPGALYVAGDDPATWAEALHAVRTDDALHGRLREAGLEHARRYSWDRAAAAVADDAVRAA